MRFRIGNPIVSAGLVVPFGQIATPPTDDFVASVTSVASVASVASASDRSSAETASS